MRRILNINAVEIINLELSRQSSREQFKELRHHIRRNLKHGFRYIYFAFQNIANLDSNFTIQEIRHPRLDSTKAVLNTDAGMLLRVLLSTDFMSSIFPDYANFLSTYNTNCITKNENQHNAIVNFSNSQMESYFYNTVHLLGATYLFQPRKQ